MDMIKKHIVLALLLACWLVAGAQEWVSGDLRYRIIGDDEAAVAPWVEEGMSLYEGVVIVPETVFYDGLTTASPPLPTALSTTRASPSCNCPTPSRASGGGRWLTRST